MVLRYLSHISRCPTFLSTIGGCSIYHKQYSHYIPRVPVWMIFPLMIYSQTFFLLIDIFSWRNVCSIPWYSHDIPIVKHYHDPWHDDLDDVDTHCCRVLQQLDPKLPTALQIRRDLGRQKTFQITMIRMIRMVHILCTYVMNILLYNYIYIIFIYVHVS